MLLIGQSLELHRSPLAHALAAPDAGPLLANARAQRALGADALDLGAGVGGAALDLLWAAAVLRPAAPGVPLWLDAGRAAALATALDLCERDGVAGPFVANALPVDELRTTAGEALLRAAVRAQATLVLTPRALDDAKRAEADRLAEACREGLAGARTGGLTASCYVDALAYPPALDAARARRSLELLRLLRGTHGVVPLVAVGNVGHGAPHELRPALRVAYAAAACGAGAGALMLPVEQPGLVAAVRAASGASEPAGALETWACAVAEASATGARVPPPPHARPELAAAARLLFG